MSLGNTVEFAHVALRLVPEVLDPVDMILLVSKQFRMIDPEVVEGRDIQYIVATLTIRVDDAIRHHLALDDRHQGRRRCIGNDLRVDLAAPLQ